MNQYVAPARVIEYVAPSPVTTFLEPPVPFAHVVLVPQVQVIEKIVEIFVVQMLKAPKLPKIWEPFLSAK